jgi:pyochelin synthetase
VQDFATRAALDGVERAAFHDLWAALPLQPSRRQHGEVTMEWLLERSSPARMLGVGGVRGPTLLQSAFLNHVAEHPGGPALICQDRIWSYGELSHRASVLGTRLLALGARRGQLVAISMERSWQQMVAMLAAMHAGAGYLLVDPEWPPELRRRVLRAGAPRMLVIGPGRADDGAADGRWRTLPFDDGCTPLDDPARSWVARQRPGDVACLVRARGRGEIFGGVQITQRTALEIVRSVGARCPLDHEDCFLAVAAPGEVLALYDLFGGLEAGAAIVIPTADETQEPRRLLELVDDYGVTVCTGTPALAQALVEEADSARIAALMSLRLLVLSGDHPISAELLRRLRWHAPRARILTLREEPRAGYRVTEAGLDATERPPLPS